MKALRSLDEGLGEKVRYGFGKMKQDLQYAGAKIKKPIVVHKPGYWIKGNAVKVGDFALRAVSVSLVACVSRYQLLVRRYGMLRRLPAFRLTRSRRIG